MDNFESKTAIVTGAGSGIGRVTAERFGAEGASVVVADIDEEGGRETVERIQDAGGEATFVRTDVTEPAQTEAMVEAALDEFGSLDIAFNNAGIEGESAPIVEQDHETWERVIAVNLGGVWNSMKSELPVMLEQGHGAIVNTASILGRVGFAGAGPYTASKHGVVGLTKNAALEYAPEGLRVNAVCPGFIRTPMIDRYGVTSDPEMEEEIANLHAVKRLGEPEEVASTVLWLSSEEASFMNGEAVAVDGGYLSQ